MNLGTGQRALVLADEPTGELDTANARIIVDYLSKVNKKLGKTVIMVTHDPTAAARALRPPKRIGRNATEPLNNLLNLGFEVLRRRVHIAVIQAHLDPYLGFLHSAQQYKPSLVYDMMEPWRATVEDLILTYHPKLCVDSFEKHGKRAYLKREETIKFTNALNKVIDKKRIPYTRRKNSKTTRIRTAIKEEPHKLAQYIKGNTETYPI